MADLTGMMQAAAGVGGEEADEYFQNTVLLLHGDGINGQQNNVFLDSSSNAFAITRNGETTQGTFSPFSKPDGAWGNYFDGSGDYLSFSSSAFAFSTGDLTFEAWIYPIARLSSNNCIFSNYSSLGANSFGLFAGHGAGNTTKYQVAVGSVGFPNIESSSNIIYNAWSHVAVVRSSGTITLYVNGVSEGTTSSNANLSSISSGWIGVSGDQLSGSEFYGYISNARAVIGTAVYTSGFTPSTTPLTAISGTSLLTCQSNRFKDNSTNSFAITVAGTPKVTPFSPFPLTTEYTASINGGSGYFDGTGDTLTSATVGTTIGTGDWCLEFWVYETAAGSLSSFVQLNNSSGYNIYLQTNSGAARFLNFQNPGNDFTLTGGTVPLNSWTHIVGTLQSGTARLFVNGVLVANQGSLTRNYGTAGTVQTGPTSTSYASDIRVTIGSVPTDYQTASTTNGTAIFTPPSAPLTVISSGATSSDVDLLYNFTNSGILDNTCFNDLITVGDAAVNTTTKKYGTGSMEFDGNGDWLLMPNTPDLQLGSGDFTVEFWINQSGGFGNYQTPFAIGYTGTGDFLIQSGLGSANGRWIVYMSGSAIATENPGTQASLGVWYHIAVVRSGSTVTIYRDGVSVASGTSSANINSTSAAGVGNSVTTTTYPLYGFIDDLRITKGVARYTANFTPPTAAFPNIGE